MIYLITIALLFGSPSPGRAEATSEDRRQLVTQAETFHEKEKPLLPEKEEIEINFEKPEVPEAHGKTSFFVKKINVEGCSLLPAKTIDALRAAYENRVVSFDEIKKLADSISALYRLAGYPTSVAWVPPQKVTGGVLTIQCLEGKIGKIRVEGNQWFDDSLYTNAIFVRPDRVLRIQDLEGSLFYLNRNEDRSARVYLEAGDDPGTSDIILKAEENYPGHVYFETHNRGTKNTHRGRHETHWDHTNLTGRGDILKTVLSMAEEGAFRAWSGEYAYPLKNDRTVLSLNASHVSSMLVGSLKSEEIKGLYRNITPSVVHHFVRTRAFELGAEIALELKDSKTTADDLKIDFDRMRVLKLGPRVTTRGANGVNYFSADFHQGLSHFLGGSDEVDRNASRTNAGGEFFYTTASLARLQKLSGSSFLVLRAGGQWSKDNLASVEQFRAGGAYSVRGYPESDSAGDSGYNLSAELRVLPFIIPDVFRAPFTGRKWSESVHVVGFLDAAKTYFRERTPTESSVKDRFLLGTGFGFRVDLENNFSFQLDLGFPIGDESKDKDRPLVHFAARFGF
ncbi:MAG: ShlB/FhaC/HecB family hemolysin secretion/activation protein [Candidatus Omnitrophica bacterium]|nr:ShlB/FhaC/HecB family hemolysin secretion/activation protein [Candidatus Omnitrophota bacterium]